MDRSKLVAVVTGAIALLLGIAYLVIVQILDFRGEMIPAPQSRLDNVYTIAVSTVDDHNFRGGILGNRPGQFGNPQRP